MYLIDCLEQSKSIAFDTVVSQPAETLNKLDFSKNSSRSFQPKWVAALPRDLEDIPDVTGSKPDEDSFPRTNKPESFQTYQQYNIFCFETLGKRCRNAVY